MGGEGGVGSPGAPQAVSKKIGIRKEKMPETSMPSRAARNSASFLVSIFEFQILQNVAAQILILHDVG
jgi:hypothetical protein